MNQCHTFEGLLLDLEAAAVPNPWDAVDINSHTVVHPLDAWQVAAEVALVVVLYYSHYLLNPFYCRPLA